MGPKGPTLQPIPKTSAPSGLAQRSGIPRPAWNFRLMCLFLAPSGSFLELLRAISLFRRCFRQGRPHGKARPRLKAEAPSHVSHCARLPGSGSGSFAMARGPVLGPKIGPPGIPMFLRRSARSELWLWPRPWTSGVLNSRLSDSVSVRLRFQALACSVARAQNWPACQVQRGASHFRKAWTLGFGQEQNTVIRNAGKALFTNLQGAATMCSHLPTAKHVRGRLRGYGAVIGCFLDDCMSASPGRS